MGRLAAVLTRFPERELEIRRLCARDTRFVEICEDYEEAVAAAGLWLSPAQLDARRAEEYRALAAEFEAELLAVLDGPAGRPIPGAD